MKKVRYVEIKIYLYRELRHYGRSCVSAQSPLKRPPPPLFSLQLMNHFYNFFKGFRKGHSRVLIFTFIVALIALTFISVLLCLLSVSLSGIRLICACLHSTLRLLFIPFVFYERLFRSDEPVCTTLLRYKIKKHSMTAIGCETPPPARTVRKQRKTGVQSGLALPSLNLGPSI